MEELECLTLQISNAHSRPFLVSTWYRPPQSPPDIFNSFEQLVGKIDAENSELYLLGDLNCNLLPCTSDHNSANLTNILDIYGLSQLITEPTRITANSQSLIDVCITNCPQKVPTSGVLHLGISDHSLVCMIRKTRYANAGSTKVIEMRNFNLFNKDKFLNDLKQKEWSKIALYSDPNEMWHLWKQLLMSSIDKHPPVKHKRIGKKKSPWITSDLLQKVHKRDYLKKKAVQTNDQNYWRQYKVARNETNNAIKTQKRKFFTTNLDANKTIRAKPGNW